MVRSRRLNLRHDAGFTLIELALVLAIAGVLGYIAMNSYNGMSAKAKTREAQVLLTREYMAERTFFVAFQSYTNCLEALKALPHGSAHFYFTGTLNVLPQVSCGPSGTVSCDTYDFNPSASATSVCNSTNFIDAYGATCNGHHCYANSNPPSALQAWAGSAPGYEATGTTFKTVAGAILTGSGVVDVWTIDHTKALLNPQSGL